MTALIIIAVIVGFVFGYAARAVTEPAPTEFRRYSANDLGLTADEAISITARMRAGGAL